MALDPFANANAKPRATARWRPPRLDWTGLLCAAALLVVGVLFVRSACSIRTGAVRLLWKKTLLRWIPLGMLAGIALARRDYRKWTDLSWVAYPVSLLLLSLVLLPGFGETQGMGARRWLFGFFQPAEAAKVVLVPTLAFVLAGSNIPSERGRFWAALALAAAPAALIVAEPDLGTAMPVVAAAAAMIFVSGVEKRTFLALCLTAALAASAVAAAILLPEKLPPEKRAKVEAVTDRFLFGHWKDRVLVFAHPERDPLGAGWNRRQSEIAVGSGGERGKGYMKGTQNILGYLPASVSSSDFIFSVIAEETGFAGSAALLLLYAGLFGGIAVTGLRARDETGRLICTGVLAMLAVHVFVNIGMTIGVTPVTGIPLPLVSYGGTFTISTLALLGMTQSVAIHGRGAGRGEISLSSAQSKW